MRPWRPDRQRLTRLAFLILVAVVVAQVAWWMVFQERLMRESIGATVAAWERDIATVTELLAANAQGQAELLERYAHLRFPPDDPTRLEVDPAARRALEARERGSRRMLALEGGFFALVVLLLLVFIAGSLRAERELKRRQQNFLGAVTHEFKTPISTLRLLVHTTRLRPLAPEKAQEYLRRMEAEIDRLERTSEQVLSSARLEEAEQPPPLAAAELNHVVQGLVGRLRPGLEVRGAELRVRYAPEALPVSIDVPALALVLSNLLDNAVKYTPGDRKPIEVTLERAGDLVLLHVDDQGVGLPHQERERVFDRFYRTGDEMTRGSSGVGLGLHLVRSVTEAMRGWVRVEEGPAGRGTRFTVVLPRRVAAAQESVDGVPSAADTP